ncbi:MAG TPA: hypothetical protein PL051_02650 [Candidatus Saccharibacteria bacterium]|nr:hypothetical protein [Candidatus Saccharibacteria bacterium]
MGLILLLLIIWLLWPDGKKSSSGGSDGGIIMGLVMFVLEAFGALFYILYILIAFAVDVFIWSITLGGIDDNK